MEQQIAELDDLHARLALVETQLATAWVRRTAGPASGLLFSGLAWLWFRSEILSAVPGSPRFFVILAPVVGYAVGLVINELNARRVIQRLKRERQRLEAALHAAGPSGDRLPAF